MVKEIQAILCFSIFGKNSKWSPFLGRGKFFENRQEYIPSIHCGSKISTKSLYLARLRRYKQFCVFPFLVKIQKFKMAAILGEGKIFLKLPIVHSSVTLWFKKFRKSLYLARLRRYKQFCVFPVLVKIRKFQIAAIFREGKFFQNWQDYIL